MIANDKLFDTFYKCPKEGCYYHAKTKHDVKRHNKEDHGEAKVVSVQKERGNPETLLEFGARKGFIPEQYKDFSQRYIATFDIECLEVAYEGKREGRDVDIEMAQKIVSVAVGSNIPNTSPQFFCRASSQPKDEEELIEQFVDCLDDLRIQYMKHVPR
mgnify:CR=1 FL=1